MFLTSYQETHSFIFSIRVTEKTESITFALCFRIGGGIMTLGGVDQKIHSAPGIMWAKLKSYTGWFQVMTVTLHHSLPPHFILLSLLFSTLLYLSFLDFTALCLTSLFFLSLFPLFDFFIFFTFNFISFYLIATHSFSLPSACEHRAIEKYIHSWENSRSVSLS